MTANPADPTARAGTAIRTLESFYGTQRCFQQVTDWLREGPPAEDSAPAGVGGERSPLGRAARLARLQRTLNSELPVATKTQVPTFSVGRRLADWECESRASEDTPILLRFLLDSKPFLLPIEIGTE